MSVVGVVVTRVMLQGRAMAWLGPIEDIDPFVLWAGI